MKNAIITGVMAATILIAGCGKKNSSSSSSTTPPTAQADIASSSSPIAADSSSPPVFQMRLVADTPSADSEEILYTNKTVGTKETLQVMKKILIDQTAVKSAKVIESNPSQISIKFSDKGKNQLAEVTRENIGKRLAMVIGGQVYSAPKIMSEISVGEAIIVVSNEQEAKELVAQITEAPKKR